MVSASSFSESPELRSPDVWFDDGNIVLSAQNTLFRVFKGILCTNCEIFRDMFAFPQPPDADTYDGVPLVHLSDTAFDMTHFLRELYFPKYIHFHLVASILS